MNPRSLRNLLLGAIALFLAWFVGWELFWVWTVKNTYVGPNEMLIMVAKTGKEMAPGQIIASPGEKGVLLEPLGTGRHFINPFLYERQLKPQVSVPAGQVGIVVAKFGNSLPSGEFLAGPGQRGIQRDVLLPGVYKLNPYAYEIRIVKMKEIDPGYVGVVTARSGTPTQELLANVGERGVQKYVWQPGLYAVNPEAYSVESLEIGYNQITMSHVGALKANTTSGDGAGKARLAFEIGDGSGGAPTGQSTAEVLPAIKFPSNDGFDITLDVTVLWQLRPEDAPSVYSRYGGLPKIENNILIPQINSTARIKGSTYGAVDFIVGDQREHFQADFQKQIEETLKAKSLQVDLAMVQDTLVPDNISGPIQQARIANEWNLANVEKTRTEAKKAELSQATGQIQLAETVVDFETQRLEGNLDAQRMKQEQEIQAQTRVFVAELRNQTAGYKADTNRKMGAAAAKVVELKGAAVGEGYNRLVKAAGTAADYAAYQFANGLPASLKLNLIYAGPGTFWTDLNASSVGPLGVLASQQK